MTRTCPNCGSRAIDEQSQFCNKCGTPFPAEEQPKKVLVRTTPRMTESPPPAAAPPVPEYYPPAPETAPVRPVATPKKVLTPPPPAKRSVPVQSGKGSLLRFERFITTQKFVRFLYLAGVIAIILLSLLVMSSGFLKPSSETTGADADPGSSSSTPDTTSPILSGLILLVFGNLFWRILCEVLVMIVTIRESLFMNNHYPAHDRAVLSQDEAIAYGEQASGGMVTCPVCGKTVPADDLEFCDHCGVQGCSSCVRKMGLLKKTFTCRECFERNK